MTKLSIIALVTAMAITPTLAIAANVGASTDVSAAASGALDTTVNATANGSAMAGASANLGDPMLPEFQDSMPPGFDPNLPLLPPLPSK